MEKHFDGILDECIDRINKGQSAEACLADYPDYAGRLEPLLRTVSQAQTVYSFIPSASAKREARGRFNSLLEKIEQGRAEKQSLFTRVFARRPVWAAVAAVLLLAIGGYLGFRYLLPSEGTAPIQVTPEPSPEGNFVFLISDEVNAIDDFESLEVSISKIGLLSGNTSAEFEPEVITVDLTLVPGDLTQEIWRGDIPEGDYNQVFIYITDVSGVLKATGQTVEVKLPSQKLHISKSFRVAANTVTSFTYDLTVIARGNAQSGVRYLLQPQADQSGANTIPEADEANRGKPQTK